MPDIQSSRRAVAGYLALLALAFLAFSCDQGHQPASGLQCDPHPVDVVTRDFADAFAPLQPLVFRTSDPSPVLSVRALSVSPSGHLLVTDNRSGDLKLADRDGRIIRVIGREGEGPGEFTALFDAVFLSDDRIVALDGGRVLTTLFDSAGVVLNTFQLREQFDPRAVVAIDDSTFLIGGLVGGLDGGNDLARIYSLDGSVSESFFPADQLLFETGMIVDRVWGVALPSGSVALGLAVTPAVHLFSETGAHMCTQASEPPQWSQLLPRDEPAAMDAATRAWIQQATLSGGAAYASGSLYRQYGSSGENGVSLLAEYDDQLNLRNIYTSPPGRLVGADAETIFFLGDESVDETRLLRFQPRRRQ
ncbi:MAG: 6-bladed beta-propeller [Gemmatimonadetes bacterium]|nr:6-bladed beta-propeller [Gemmatimonadota bacterium]